MCPGLDYHENHVEQASCFMLSSRSNTGNATIYSFSLCFFLTLLRFKQFNIFLRHLAYSGIFQHLTFFLSFSNKKVLCGISSYVSFISCLGFSIEQEQNVQFQFLVMSNSAPSHWMGTWLIRFRHYYKSYERLQKNFYRRVAVEYCNVLP